jgi:hypothetical protein
MHSEKNLSNTILLLSNIIYKLSSIEQTRARHYTKPIIIRYSHLFIPIFVAFLLTTKLVP